MCPPPPTLGEAQNRMERKYGLIYTKDEDTVKLDYVIKGWDGNSGEEREREKGKGDKTRGRGLLGEEVYHLDQREREREKDFNYTCYLVRRQSKVEP